MATAENLRSAVAALAVLPTTHATAAAENWSVLASCLGHHASISISFFSFGHMAERKYWRINVNFGNKNFTTTHKLLSLRSHHALNLGHAFQPPKAEASSSSGPELARWDELHPGTLRGSLGDVSLLQSMRVFPEDLEGMPGRPWRHFVFFSLFGFRRIILSFCFPFFSWGFSRIIFSIFPMFSNFPLFGFRRITLRNLSFRGV